ncbi:MAG: DsrE family protein [Hydrogenibacillus schlegelii]|nr:DsrE family protein [Hydrogenibacillus schlegelii]
MAGRLAYLITTGPDNEAKALSALRVASRTFFAREELGLETVEIFFFVDGLKWLAGLQDEDEAHQLLKELLQAGAVVAACGQQAERFGVADRARDLGLALDLARDTFARYARDGYTVITL